jgi:hypothetical protein
MAIDDRTTDDLIRIAASGGGFMLAASRRTTDDLIRIAAAGSTKGARLTFTGIGHRTTDDLIRIGAAGKGCVVLAD